MNLAEIANEAAEAVFRRIEDTKRINKAEIADAIEAVLLRRQPAPSYGMAMLVRPAIDREADARQTAVSTSPRWINAGVNVGLDFTVRGPGAIDLCGND